MSLIVRYSSSDFIEGMRLFIIFVTLLEILGQTVKYNATKHINIKIIKYNGCRAVLKKSTFTTNPKKTIPKITRKIISSTDIISINIRHIKKLIGLDHNWFCMTNSQVSVEENFKSCFLNIFTEVEVFLDYFGNNFSIVAYNILLVSAEKRI